VQVPSHSKYGNWQKYNNPNLLQQKLLGRFLDTVDRLVAQSSARSVADVGCAEGYVLERLQRHPQMVCAGADVDLAALQRGRQEDPRPRLQQMSVYNIAYPSQSFEMVLCLEVLEHLNDPARALAELKRVSRRYVLLSVPHEPFFQMANLLRGKNLSRLGNDPEHVNHWSQRGFAQFLRESGLTLLALEAPFPWLVALAEHEHGH